MQLLELVIFAALAGVVLFQLYAVLGRKVGRQPEDAAKLAKGRPALERKSAVVEDVNPSAALSGVAGVRARDPKFEPEGFLDGARQAYALVVRGFAAGDRAALEGLVGPVVFQAFDRAITEREAAGRTETMEFLQEPRADLEEASMVGDTARVRVRFLAEVRSRTKDASGEAVDDRRTAEAWTFERSVNSRDPNWTLVRVDPAER